jgi:SAM-dependent methyltransferase
MPAKKRRKVSMTVPCLIDLHHRDGICQRACKDKTHDRFLLREVARDMMARLQDFQDKPETVVLMDDVLGVLGDHVTQSPLPLRAVSHGGDAVMNLLGLDYAPSVPQVFHHAKDVLNPRGLLILTTFGPRTLGTLKEALYHTDMHHHQGAGLRFMPTIAPPDLAKLATQAGFRNPVVDAHLYRAHYDHCFDLVRDLRSMALGNALKERCRRPLMRSHVTTLMQDYPREDDGRFVVTFEILTLVAHL